MTAPILFSWLLALLVQPMAVPPPPPGVQPPPGVSPPAGFRPPAGPPIPGVHPPPGGPPPQVKPPQGTVSPEVGGSVLLTRPPEGERLIPSCPHDPNPGDVLRLESLALSVTVGADSVRLHRKLTFSPTTAWKPVCDHQFFLGEPETVWTEGARTQVWFSQPPRTRQEVPVERLQLRELRSFGTGGGNTGSEPVTLVGARLTLAPLPGNPADHRLALEVEQQSVVFPEPGEGGLTSLNLPLTHLSRYTPSKTLAITVQVEFAEPWHFHGATLPENGHLENRVTWELTAVPETDLKLLFSGEAPAPDPEPEPSARPESLGEKILRWTLLALVLAAILGILLLSLRGRRRPK